MSLYETLGVGRGASAEDVKRAYRKRARATHPDKGGSDAEFQAVNHAYQVLSSPERRERYDSTGADGQEQDEASELMSALIGLVFQIIESANDVSQVNVIGEAKRCVSNAVKGHKEGIKRHNHRVTKLERAAGRLKHKSGENSLAGMLMAQAEKERQAIGSINMQILKAEKVLALLDEYEYQLDEPYSQERYRDFMMQGMQNYQNR